jgi:hypothetical protein
MKDLSEGVLEHLPAKPVPDLIRDGYRVGVENATKQSR